MRNVLGLIPHLRTAKNLFILSTVVTILGSTTLAGVSLVSVWITSRFFLDQSSGQGTWFWVLAALVISHGVATLLEVWWSHEVASKILHALRNHVYAAISRIAPLGLKGRKTADVASVAMSDIEQLEWFYAHTASTAINAVVSPLIILGAISVYAGPVVFVMVFAHAAMVLVAFALVPVQQRQGQQVRNQLVELRRLCLESVHGQRELISLGLLAKNNERIRKETARIQLTKRAQILRQALESTASGLIIAAGTIGLMVWATANVTDVSTIPLIIVGAGVSSVPALSLVAMIGRIGEIGSCAGRLHELTSAQDPIQVQRDIPPGTLKDAAPLAFHEVEFSYATSPVLSGLSFKTPPRKIIGIVGASGAGKTTIARLAMRFLDPNAGSITHFGRDIRTLTPDAYRENTALVPQESYIFSGSVEENLRIADAHADDQACWAALEASGLKAKIEQLGGLTAENVELSGGERQRLGIARAFLRNAEVILLDEPLANLDASLERAVRKNLQSLCAGHSVIVIAHRLATISIADHIVLVKDGKIAAEGSYHEMLDNPEFRALFRAQL